MKIVFAGTPQFAAEHLKILIASDHQICCILTQPDRRSGRGKQIKLSPVKEVGLENGIEVLQPSALREKVTVEALKSNEPDLMLVVAYGLLVPKEVLNIPKMGCVNVHASILPKWRGAAPIENSIYSGDKETGITYMRMSEGLDEGPILEVNKCKIDSLKCTIVRDEGVYKTPEVKRKKIFEAYSWLKELLVVAIIVRSLSLYSINRFWRPSY